MRAAWMLIPMLLSCSSPEPRPWVFEGCDALDPAKCALPFPSSVHLTPDDTTETGWRVALDGAVLPEAVNGARIDPTRWNVRDGFTIGTPMIAAFPGLDTSDLARQDSIGRSLGADSKTMLLDLTTGERVAHWVEVDAQTDDPAEQLTIVWPAQALDFDHQYLVGFRGITDTDGAPIAPSPAFQTLRDGADTTDPGLLNRQAHYDEVLFPALEAEGWSRDEVVLAWDLHTASRQSTLGRLDHMVEDGLAYVDADGLPYTVDNLDDNDCSVEGTHIWRTLSGTYTVPMYTEAATSNTFLTDGPDGLPVRNGTRDTRFIVRVPCSLQQNPGPGFVMQYGHGLLGTEGEVRAGWLAEFIDENRMIAMAAPQTGMAAEDYGAIAVFLSADLSRFPTLPDRLHQGVLEQILLMRLALGPLAQDPRVAVEGTALIDPDDRTRRGWYGISQGGIIGGAVVGASPDIDRAVFSVGGAPYALLLPRSSNFTDFLDILKTRYPDPSDQTLIIHGLLGHLWDAGESVAWSHDLRDRQVLSQIALGDAQVHVQGARFQARSMGAELVVPETRDVFGLETREAPFTGSAYVEVDYGLSWPTENLPPSEDTNPHACPRKDPVLQEQVAHFLLEGEVIHTCDGPCVTTLDEGC